MTRLTPRQCATIRIGFLVADFIDLLAGLLIVCFLLWFVCGCGNVDVAQVDGATDTTNADTTVRGDTPKLANGVGCIADGECSSGACARANPSDASGMCCDVATDVCTMCVGGRAVPRPDGAMCAVPTCDGPTYPTGFGTSVATALSTNFACLAGACTAAVTDCRTKTCGCGVDGQYVGCFLNGNNPTESRCDCVTRGGEFCGVAP